MRLFIVRHGETDWNLEGRIQGQTDIPLNDRGREQAQKIANRLRLETIDVIVTSPLQRAKFTAQTIAKYHPKAIFLEDKVLSEISAGSAEGLTKAEYFKKFPSCLRFTPHEAFSSKLPNGESYEERLEKLIPIIERWKQEYQGKTVLLSTHGAAKKVLLIALQVATYESLKGMHFQNTALSIIKPFDMEQIELLNDSSHLQEL